MGCEQAEVIMLLKHIRETLVTKGRDVALAELEQVIEALETEQTAAVLRKLGLV